jgi:hypothetical protein
LAGAVGVLAGNTTVFRRIEVKILDGELPKP